MALLAQNFKDAIGIIEKPPELSKYGPGAKGINQVLDKSVAFIFMIAAVGFVVMFLWGAVQMIISGGDKEALAKARGRITWAIIGMVILALSFAIFRILGDLLGFKLLQL